MTSMDRRNGNGHRERDLGALIDLYLLRCAVEGKSPHTLKAYRETLGRFARIARDEGFPKDVAGITPAHLYAYLGRYTDHSMETRHRYFREVRCFFNWLVQAGYLKETPFRSLRNVRLPQRIVQPFSPEEVARLLEGAGLNVPLSIDWKDGEPEADGIDDWRSRRVTVVLEP